EHPDEYARLLEDPNLLPVAVEEFIRWVTPILNMRRTATRDTEIAGTPVQAGDGILLMYPSANRDQSGVDYPDPFHVRRGPDPPPAVRVGHALLLGRRARPSGDPRDVRGAAAPVAQPALGGRDRARSHPERLRARLPFVARRVRRSIAAMTTVAELVRA